VEKINETVRQSKLIVIHHGEGVVRNVKTMLCVICTREDRRRRKQGLPPDPNRRALARDKVAARNREARTVQKKLAIVAKHVEQDEHAQHAKRMAKINCQFLQLLTFEKLRSIQQARHAE
jgi:hypothetical protein